MKRDKEIKRFPSSCKRVVFYIPPTSTLSVASSERVVYITSNVLCIRKEIPVGSSKRGTWLVVCSVVSHS